MTVPLLCSDGRPHLPGAVAYYNSLGRIRAEAEDDYYCAAATCRQCGAALVTYNVAEAGLPIWEATRRIQSRRSSAWRRLLDPAQLRKPFAIAEEP